MIGDVNEILLWALEIIFIKFLCPLFDLARHKSSYDSSSSLKTTFKEQPEIGLIPDASHLSKNFTRPNIFALSVIATEGIDFLTAFSTIWFTVNKPWEILYSEETLKWENKLILMKLP